MHGHMQRRHADKTLNQQLHLVEDAMLLAGLYRSEWQLQMGMDLHEAMGRAKLVEMEREYGPEIIALIAAAPIERPTELRRLRRELGKDGPHFEQLTCFVALHAIITQLRSAITMEAYETVYQVEERQATSAERATEWATFTRRVLQASEYVDFPVHIFEAVTPDEEIDQLDRHPLDEEHTPLILALIKQVQARQLARVGDLLIKTPDQPQPGVIGAGGRTPA